MRTLGFDWKDFAKVGTVHKTSLFVGEKYLQYEWEWVYQRPLRELDTGLTSKESFIPSPTLSSSNTNGRLTDGVFAIEPL